MYVWLEQGRLERQQANVSLQPCYVRPHSLRLIRPWGACLFPSLTRAHSLSRNPDDTRWRSNEAVQSRLMCWGVTVFCVTKIQPLNVLDACFPWHPFSSLPFSSELSRQLEDGSCCSFGESGLSARASYAWTSCVFGGAVAIVHTSYCNMMAGKTDQAILDMALDVSFGGWPDAVLRNDWDVFTLLSVQSKMLLTQRPSVLADALASSMSPTDATPRSCEGDRHVSGKSLLECAWLVASLPEECCKL